MKKLQIALLILVVIALFAFADYFVNVPEGIKLPSIPQQTQQQPVSDGPQVANYPNITQAILNKVESGDYKIEKRSRSTELFERFNLSAVGNVAVFRNIVIKADKTPNQQPVWIYEVHGPLGQGRVTYLNLKLQMIEQLGGESGINETGDYGYNSLFYNDTSNPGTGFLLSQVGDYIFGFQYSKDSTEAFDFIKDMINTYMSMIEST